jgi:diguanylate cyclase (GGDEF)-like protein/PAS domain S-box-containing protein
MNLLNQIPCPTLITNGAGRILLPNSALLALVGGSTDQWRDKTMETLLSMASRIFLQSYIWPMLFREEKVSELYLHLRDSSGQRVPVMVNCQRGDFEGAEAYYWVFFVAHERNRFEAELLNARHRAEASAVALAKAECFVKNIANAMPGMISYWDKDLRCHFANPVYLEWFGKSPEAIIGFTLRDLLGEPLFTEHEAYIRAVLAGEKQVFERSLIKADGSVGHTLVNYLPDFDPQGKVVGFFVWAADVTPLKRAEAELKLAASVFQNTTEGIFITDAKGIIRSVNPAFSEITGYSAEEAIGQTPRLMRSNRHDAEFHSAVWREIITHGQWKGEIWNRRKSGEVFLEWQTITRMGGTQSQPTSYISLFHDVTDTWRKDEHVRHLAFHDALTDLPNRALLIERIERHLAIAEREQRGLAVLFLDLDRFKWVNDTLGHEVGDEVLKTVAQKLQALVRHTDTVARLGGDEFVILLDNPAHKNEVAEIAQRIVGSINQPMNFAEKTAQVGTSIGIALFPVDGKTPVDLLKNADTALYAAKNGGKNTYRFFETELLAANHNAP